MGPVTVGRNRIRRQGPVDVAVELHKRDDLVPLVERGRSSAYLNDRPVSVRGVALNSEL
jgi:hypothetical protein